MIRWVLKDTDAANSNLEQLMRGDESELRAMES